MIKRLSVLVAALLVSSGLHAEKGRIYTIRPGDWLSRIAVRNYNDVSSWPAILLATNRDLEPFLSNPNLLSIGRKVSIPDPGSARKLNTLYSDYLRAVKDMMLPQPWETAPSLVTIARDTKRCTVVTWTRTASLWNPKCDTVHYNDQVIEVALGDTIVRKDVWVTVVPHLRNFCRNLNLSSENLDLRLEQRLGVPPLNGKTEFVEIVVPADSLFRPCIDPSIHTARCGLGPPADAPESHQIWFYKQYYGSYSLARPSQYPWTALGYTYDWGQEEGEIGESEFIIRSGTVVRILSVVLTEDYCDG